MRTIEAAATATEQATGDLRAAAAVEQAARELVKAYRDNGYNASPQTELLTLELIELVDGDRMRAARFQSLFSAPDPAGFCPGQASL